MSKRTRILATIFGGWFGLHKYLDKNIGMGILYTFTCGLFGIGWIYDIIKSLMEQSNTTPHQKSLSKSDLIRWQNLVLHSDCSQLSLNLAQLRNASDLIVDDNLRILNDSLKLIKETSNPEVYFKRIDLIIECYNNLADLEEFYPTGIEPVSKIQNFNESSLLHDFIQRYWFKTVSDAEKLKTEKAKNNRKEKAKQILYTYSDKIDLTNLEYIKQLS